MLRQTLSSLVGCGGRLLIQARSFCSIVPTKPQNEAESSDGKPAFRRMPSSRQEMYEALVRLKPDSPPDSRVLRIGLLGVPGAGKSTLINRLALFQACATSQKINTTRSKQNVVLTQGNVQLVFLDLPGIISKQKARRHRVEVSLIRDPHAGIHQSDIILVVVDMSNPYSRKRLDKEVLRALHFFKEKPTILVLNKIDKLGKRRTLLLDSTRLLSGGVVGGKVSHRDVYTNRYRWRKSSVDVQKLLESPATAALEEKHRTGELDGLSDDEVIRELEKIKDLESLPAGEGEEEEEEDEEESFHPVPQGSQEEVRDAIDSFFDDHSDQLSSGAPLVPPESPELIDPMLALLRHQMMLESASRAEVAARVRRWHKLDDVIRGQHSWLHFNEVFMVSSVSGKGINFLRDYLLEQAKPGPWVYHSSLASDQDPYDTVSLAVKAQCMNLLRQEVPYRLAVEVAEYEKNEDGTVFVEANILCRNDRQIKSVLGPGGETIRKIALAATTDIQNAMQTNVCLRLACKLSRIPKSHLRFIKASGDFRKSFPNLEQ